MRPQRSSTWVTEEPSVTRSVMSQYTDIAWRPSASTNAAVSGETVVVPYTSGELFALRVQNGQVGWSDVLSRTGRVTALSQLDDIAGRPVIDRGVVYAVSQSGLMAAFSINTGLGTVEVAAAEVASRLICTSLNIKAEEERYRFGFAA